MTLIIAGICKNGVCICADKRRIIKHTNAPTERKDDQYKIYKFKDLPIIIYNHGINIINGNPWNHFCSEYEKSENWKNKNFQDIVDDFKNFIESDVTTKLRKNTLDNSLGFVICGKTPHENAFKSYELFWNPNLQKKPCYGLVRSGDGKKYLEDILSENPDFDTMGFWKNKDVSNAKKELQKIFLLAVEKKQNLNGEEFSSDFDMDTINI